MYRFFWDHIPGPWPVKLVVTLIVLVAVFFLLMEIVYPWVSTLMPYNNVSV